MRKNTVFIYRLMALALPAVSMGWGSSVQAQLKLEAAPEYFYWKEEVNGERLLDESGFRMGLELSYKPRREQGWLWASRAKVYGGAVDYDGRLRLADGEVIPINSTTEYYGALIEGRFGYRWPLGTDYFFDGLAGVGVEGWLRRLTGRGGYDEFWLPLYAKAGFEASPREIGWIGALGLKVPFYTSEFVKVEGLGTLTFHPEPLVSLYAEAGYRFTRRFSVVAFFDSFWFKASEPSEGYYQPDSNTFQAGAKFGWAF